MDPGPGICRKTAITRQNIPGRPCSGTCGYHPAFSVGRSRRKSFDIGDVQEDIDDEKRWKSFDIGDVQEDIDDEK